MIIERYDKYCLCAPAFIGDAIGVLILSLSDAIKVENFRASRPGMAQFFSDVQIFNLI
jgi:hypothetical protein